MPRVLLTVELRLNLVVDLTGAIARGWRGLDLTTVVSDTFAPCQEFASLVRQIGYEAIRYPSATGEGENLAVFYDRLQAASSAVVINRKTIDSESLDE